MTRNAMTNRRTTLKLLSLGFALPWLEGISVFGGDAAKRPPLRYMNLYFGNGISGNWGVRENEGTLELSGLLTSLKPHAAYCTVVTGLTTSGRNHHGLGFYLSGLTGSGKEMPNDPKNIPGAPLSIDQVFADRWANTTELPCLVLGCEPTRGNGGETNISWRVGAPLPKEVDPTAAFDALFNGPLQRRRNQSVLDFVQDDLKRLSREAGAYDKQRIDEYTNSIREVERRIEAAAQPRQDDYTPTLQQPDLKRPQGMPPLPEYMRLMMDIALLAYRMNKTRVISLMLNNELSKMDFGFVDGVKGLLHAISHGEGSKGAHELTSKFHLDLFAEFLDKCKKIDEYGQPLLDNMAIHFGSIMRTGGHSQLDVPCILAGKAGGALKGGRHVVADKRLLGDMNLGLAQKLGMEMDRFGDRTKPIDL